MPNSNNSTLIHNFGIYVCFECTYSIQEIFSLASINQFYQCIDFL